MKILMALILTVLTNSAQAGGPQLSCELKDGIGRSPTGNTQVDLDTLTIHATLRCYDTGDVWWDCDEIHEKVVRYDGSYDIAFEGEKTELVFTKASGRAALYVNGNFFFDLTCKLYEGDSK